MVPRPVGLIERFVNIIFNNRHYSIIEIDINHINHGKNGNRTSDLEIFDIVNISLALLDGVEIEYIDEKIYGDTRCHFYVREGTYRSKKYRMVFCVCSDFLEKIGVITLYRI